MRFAPDNNVAISAGERSRRRPGEQAFTLAEVLAALVFMAIVIPVAISGLNVASRAGEVAVRKAEAALVAERLLNESVVTTNWSQAVQTGTIRQGIRDYRFNMRNEPWNGDPAQNDIRLLTVEVLFTAQGHEHAVRMATLVDEYSPFAQTNANSSF